MPVSTALYGSSSADLSVGPPLILNEGLRGFTRSKILS
jgi:hypothetical protein